MSGPELFVDDIDGRLHAALVRKGRLDALYTDPPGGTNSTGWGSVHLGKVVKIDKKLDAAIIDLGGGTPGLLPAHEIRQPGAGKSEDRTGIGERLKGGQAVIVQVKSEARQEGIENDKLPRLTMNVRLPGLFLSYSPFSGQVTISSGIGNENILALTTHLKGKGGWIILPAAEKASADELAFETRSLEGKWQALLEAKDAGKEKPDLLSSAPDALSRALTECNAAGLGHIHVGSRKILDLAMAWCAAHLPALADSKRLRLFKPEKPGQRLFDIHDLYEELEALRQTRVELPGGSSLIIETTAAFTAIDVNQGADGNTLNANLAATREIARQCRLRNLGGIILADFINMKSKEQRARLLETLQEAFSGDGAEPQAHGFTRLGIIEITRPRRTATYLENMKK